MGFKLAKCWRFIIILLLCCGSVCNAFAQQPESSSTTEDEIFDIYKPKSQNFGPERPIILDFSRYNRDGNAVGALENSNKNLDISVSFDNFSGDSFEDLTTDALLALQKGHYEAADVLYRKALAAAPDNTDVLFAIGYTNQKLKKLEVAKDFYRKVLKLDNYHHKAFHNFFEIFAEQDPTLALHKLRQMASEHPYHPVVIAQLGITYFNINNMQLALKHLRKAVYLDPQNPDYQYKLGVVYDNFKDYESAVQYYNQALDLYDKNSQIPPNDLRERVAFLGG